MVLKPRSVDPLTLIYTLVISFTAADAFLNNVNSIPTSKFYSAENDIIKKPEESSIPIVERSKQITSECGCGRVFSEESLATRVAGGQVIGPKDHPFLALLLYQDLFICGASIIDTHYILTAAHCVPHSTDKKDLLVKVGIHDMNDLYLFNVMDDQNGVNSYPVRKIIRHKSYQTTNYSSLINDIALLQVDKITFNDYIQPICLPVTSDFMKKYKSAVVQGWGYTNSTRRFSQVPRQTVLSLLTQEQCRRSRNAPTISNVKGIYHKTICAYKAKADACSVWISSLHVKY